MKILVKINPVDPEIALFKVLLKKKEINASRTYSPQAIQNRVAPKKRPG